MPRATTDIHGTYMEMSARLAFVQDATADTTEIEDVRSNLSTRS